MFIKSIHLKNILSFGENTPVLELKDLNILIGANGSGKSNLIDVIEVLKQEENSIVSYIHKTGGVRQWVWKKDEDENNKIASIEMVFFSSKDKENKLHFSFNNYTQQISNIPNKYNSNKEQLINAIYIDSQENEPIPLHGIRVLNYIRNSISLFRDWSFGRKIKIREPQLSDAPKQFIKSDFSNLNLVLSEISLNPKAKDKLLNLLKKVNEDFTDYQIFPVSNYFELYLREGEKTIPSSRLSDGTLRYLCLLAILCHPNPPPLICIEEPELGFHPDLLPTIAELLKDASTRTQLIVTTHSDILIDCFSDTPEAVIVFDKVEGSTTMTRLSRDDLKHWMDKKFSLGKHWLSGQIGGLRY